MMFEKFTNRAKHVIKLAKKEAQKFNHSYLGTEHLLLALLKLDQGIASNLLRDFGVTYELLASHVEQIVGYGPDINLYGDPAMTGKVKKVVELANEEASSLNHNYVGTEHLLLGLIRLGDGVATQLLTALNVNLKELRKEILRELETFNLQVPPLGSTHQNHFDGKLGDKLHGPTGQTASSLEKTPALKAYGQDLTEMARQSELDPVIGRESEVERLILILCRRRKNNPVLIGEPGVGKTAIVEALAHRIAKGEVPEALAKKKVINLDLTLMIAGTKYRGQFEERIKAVMDEVRKNGQILLFIDELHTIVGAGAAEGAIDASNILKPALSRGEIQCIGATTLDEYRKHIEKDGALDRRFQKIQVEPPSENQAIQILSGLKNKYESFHHCVYTDKAIHDAVVFAKRYIRGRFLPDSAIDLIDEAGAKARIGSLGQPIDMSQLEDQIESVRLLKDDAIEHQDYEKAAQMRDQEKQLREQLLKMRKAWEVSKEERVVNVDEEAIAQIVAKQTGVPLSKLTEEESSRLVNLEKILQETIIGQNEALLRVSKAIRRGRADIKDPKRPIGSFLFLGPTGVGKTLLARQLAIQLFGGEDALIKVDMSEYMEKFAVSRMTGSPPGYVGHEEGGQLTERVRQRPYSVVLFDEVEKAHPDVMHLLLQILEDGCLTDSLGRQVDFCNTIVILTSNLGSDLVRRSGEIGFTLDNKPIDYLEMERSIEKSVKKYFKPEFINRLDSMVIFKPFEKAEVNQIVRCELRKLEKRLAHKGIHLQIEDKAFDFLAEKGYIQEMGARPLRRAIQEYLEDPLAEKILTSKKQDRRFDVMIKEDGLEIVEKELSLSP